jgi:hypothetical protein
MRPETSSRGARRVPHRYPADRWPSPDPPPSRMAGVITLLRSRRPCAPSQPAARGNHARPDSDQEVDQARRGLDDVLVEGDEHPGRATEDRRKQRDEEEVPATHARTFSEGRRFHHYLVNLTSWSQLRYGMRGAIWPPDPGPPAAGSARTRCAATEHNLPCSGDCSSRYRASHARGRRFETGRAHHPGSSLRGLPASTGVPCRSRASAASRSRTRRSTPPSCRPPCSA